MLEIFVPLLTLPLFTFTEHTKFNIYSNIANLLVTILIFASTITNYFYFEFAFSLH